MKVNTISLASQIYSSEFGVFQVATNRGRFSHIVLSFAVIENRNILRKTSREAFLVENLVGICNNFSHIKWKNEGLLGGLPNFEEEESPALRNFEWHLEIVQYLDRAIIISLHRQN